MNCQQGLTVLELRWWDYWLRVMFGSTNVLNCLGGAVAVVWTVVYLIGRDSLFNVKLLEIVWFGGTSGLCCVWFS